MAALSEQLANGDETPAGFERAVESLRSARTRPEVKVTPIRPPGRLAPYSYALAGSVVSAGAELAEGRLVLLHDPDGQASWHGTFRVVVLARAELDPEIATDPLLPEVGWSWLTGALAARGARYAEPSGTVSRSSSHFFGGLADRPATTLVEIRASWTPLDDGARSGPGPDLGAHLAAWCDLLCVGGGLPPAPPEADPQPPAEVPGGPAPSTTHGRVPPMGTGTASGPRPGSRHGDGLGAPVVPLPGRRDPRWR